MNTKARQSKAPNHNQKTRTGYRKKMVPVNHQMKYKVNEKLYMYGKLAPNPEGTV